MSGLTSIRPGLAALAVGLLAAVGGAAPAFAAQERPVRAAASGSSSTPLRVVALGDSVPSGGGCGCVKYPSIVGSALGALQGRTVRMHNDAVGGNTSASVRAQVRTPAVASDVKYADLAIITVGANDFDEDRIAACASKVASCYAPQLTALRSNLTATIQNVSSTQYLAASEVVVTGYWNVFKDGKVGRARGSAYVLGSDRLTRLVNATIKSVAAENGAIYVDEYAPFKGSAGTRDVTALLAADGDHLSAAGHRVMGNAIVAGLGRKAALV